MPTNWDSVVSQWAAAETNKNAGSVLGDGAGPSAASGNALGEPPSGRDDGEPLIGAAAAGPADAEPSWGGTVDVFHQMRVQASQAALYASKDIPPDKGAQALDLAGQTGAPASVVARDLPTYQARAQAISNAATLKADPVLADWLAQNPVAPQVVSDDLAKLSTVGRLWREAASGWAQGQAGQQLGRAYYDGQSAATSPEVAALERVMQASGPFDSGIVHGLAAFGGQMADLFAHAAPLATAGAVAGGGIGALATGVPTGGLAAPVGAGAGAAVGGAAGFAAGVFSDTFRSWVGTYLHSTADTVDASGNHVDPTVRLGTALVGGLVNAGLNTFGLHVGLPGMGQAAGTLADEALARAVARPTVASALGNLSRDLAAKGLSGAAAGAVLGAAMGGVDVLADQTARMLSSGSFATILNDPAQRAAAVSELEQNIASMALMMGSTHAIAPFGSFARDVLAAHQASGDIAALHALEQGSVASATRARSPSVFQDWLERQNPDGAGAESLYVPAQRVQELYQRLGVEPDGNDGLLGPVAPDIRDQLAQGLPAGGDVVLPMSAFITHLAGSDVSRALMPDIRTRPDGMSLNDAAQFRAEYQDAIRRAGAEVDQQAGQPATSRDAISDDVFGQARQAGFTNDASRQYAALISARYATRGERLGVDPMDLYREEGLTIRAADAQAKPAAAAPDNLDVLINAMRSGRAEPSDASLHGPSLMQFLANRGGVVDQGGELSGVGADRWHLGKPGQRRFIRPAEEDAGAALPGFEGTRAASSEYGLEGAAEAAHEAGYLPDAGPSTLVEAVRHEVGGEPVRSQRNVDQRRIEFRAAVDDLREALEAQGIDPAKATNAEVRRALAYPDPSRTFEQGEVPIVRFRREAAAIEGRLAAPAEGTVRLWRGNRAGEIGMARQFTNDLAGIALPFREAYGGDISHVEVPAAEAERYLNRTGSAPGAESCFPPSWRRRRGRRAMRWNGRSQLPRQWSAEAARRGGHMHSPGSPERLRTARCL